MFLQKDERVWAEVRLWVAQRIEVIAEDGVHVWAGSGPGAARSLKKPRRLFLCPKQDPPCQDHSS